MSYYTFSSLILSSVGIIRFYILCKRFFLKREGLSDAEVASIIKQEYDFAVNCLERFIKSLKSKSDEWLNAICWSFRLFSIFVILLWNFIMISA